MLVLDATRLCSRGTPDASAWAVPAPEPARRRPATPPSQFSWRALARNPRAAAVTGLFAPLLAVDAVVRTLNSSGR
jgi:hypothetical protein